MEWEETARLRHVRGMSTGQGLREAEGVWEGALRAGTWEGTRAWKGRNQGVGGGSLTWA